MYRVLHIFSSVGGGISSLVNNLAHNRTSDFDFSIMTFSYKGGEIFLKRMTDCGVECHLMPRPRVEGWNNFKCYLEKIFSENRYDAVHCHITGWRVKPFYDVAKKHGIKTFILHAHTTRYDSWIDRIPMINHLNKYLNYRYSTHYMVCSDLAAEYIFGQKFLKKRKADLIPNGIDAECFKKNTRDKDSYYLEFNIKKGTQIIGHVGRFSFPKNHDFIIELAKEMKELNHSFVIVLVGDGELFQNVKMKIHQEGLDDVFRLIGKRTDISSLMDVFDCMILPSHNEGLPTVAVECQASGTKMFLSDSITRQCDMELGLLDFLPITDVDIWKEKIISFGKKEGIDKLECINNISNRGFTSEKVGERYCRIIREALEKK